MAKRSRDKMITFWVTEDELAKINANMEKLGTSNLERIPAQDGHYRLDRSA